MYVASGERLVQHDTSIFLTLTRTIDVASHLHLVHALASFSTIFSRSGTDI